MNTNITTIEGPELATDVVCLEQAAEQTDDEVLTETIELATENGYFLIEIQSNKFFGTQYFLEQVNQ